MYKFLLFDLDNTLLDFDLAEDKALTQLLIEQNIDCVEEYKKVYVPLNKKLWHKLDSKEISREYLINNRFSLLFEHFGIEVDGKKLARRYKQLLGEQGEHIFGADKLLKKLSTNYEIYAITNGITEIQNNRLKNSTIKNYFNKIFISEEIGHQKPSEQFFEYVANNIENFEKEKALVIGDNLFADILGANNFNINSVWCNFKNEQNNSNIYPTYEIKNYEDLEKIIKENE